MSDEGKRRAAKSHFLLAETFDKIAAQIEQATTEEARRTVAESLRELARQYREAIGR